MKLSDILDSPNKWVKEVLAADCDGMMVATDDPEACKFCLYGAVIKLGYHDETYASTLDAILEQLTGGYIYFNDSPDTTFEDIKQLVAKAEAEAEVELQ